MHLLISTWNFNQLLRSGELNLDSLATLALDRGFAGIEIMDRQLEHCDVDKLGDHFRKLRCEVILDVGCDLTLSQAESWRHEVDYVKGMLEIAVALGAAKVRIILGGQKISVQKVFRNLRLRKQDESDEEAAAKEKTLLAAVANTRVLGRLAHAYRRRLGIAARGRHQKIQRVAQALREIVPEAQRWQTTVVIENHWGISSDPIVVKAVIDAIDSPWLRACPDLSNWPKEVDPYQALALLAPVAAHVHANTTGFKKGGEERNIDYSRCLGILKKCGYDGSITIEYEGGGDVFAGISKTRDLVRKYW